MADTRPTSCDACGLPLEPAALALPRRPGPHSDDDPWYCLACAGARGLMGPWCESCEGASCEPIDCRTCDSSHAAPTWPPSSMQLRAMRWALAQSFTGWDAHCWRVRQGPGATAEELAQGIGARDHAIVRVGDPDDMRTPPAREVGAMYGEARRSGAYLSRIAADALRERQDMPDDEPGAYLAELSAGMPLTFTVPDPPGYAALPPRIIDPEA